MNQIEFRKYFFPEKGKIKFYKKVTGQNRKVVQIAKGQTMNPKYRPIWQTPYGVACGHWRIIGRSMNIHENDGFYSISKTDYDSLEKKSLKTKEGNRTV